MNSNQGNSQYSQPINNKTNIHTSQKSGQEGNRAQVNKYPAEDSDMGRVNQYESTESDNRNRYEEKKKIEPPKEYENLRTEIERLKTENDNLKQYESDNNRNLKKD